VKTPGIAGRFHFHAVRAAMVLPPGPSCRGMWRQSPIKS